MIPESGRSSGEGNGNPLQYSCLENLMDRGAWWATVCGIAESQTQLRDWNYATKTMLCLFISRTPLYVKEINFFCSRVENILSSELFVFGLIYGIWAMKFLKTVREFIKFFIDCRFWVIWMLSPPPPWVYYTEIYTFSSITCTVSIFVMFN